MKEVQLIYTLLGVLSPIFNIVLLIASFILFSKKKNPGSLLMLIGTIGILIASVARISINLFGDNISAESQMYSSAMISLANSILFGLFTLGLLIFAFKSHRKAD